MANEDVIERYETWINSGIVGLDGGKHECARFAAELAAALREAREDTKRLARAARLVVEIDGDYCACIKSPDELAYRCLTCLLKEEIDAAMKPPGGEGSSHE